MRCWHLTFTDPLRHTFFPGEAGLRAAVRTVGRVARDKLVIFSIVDDHVHLVLACREEHVRRSGRDLLFAFRPLSEVEISPPHIRQVDGRRHLENLIRYLLLQPEKHGMPGPTALWSGTCLPELVGARIGIRLCLSDVLPRFRLREVFPTLGLPAQPIQPVSNADIRRLGAGRLVSAGLAAACLPPEPQGQGELLVRARNAISRLAWQADIPASEVAFANGVAPRSVYRHRAAPPDSLLEHAVRMRLALEEAATRTNQLLGSPPHRPPPGPQGKHYPRQGTSAHPRT